MDNKSIYSGLPLLWAMLIENNVFKSMQTSSNGVRDYLEISPCKHTPNNFFSTNPEFMGTREEIEKFAISRGYKGCEILRVGGERK